MQELTCKVLVIGAGPGGYVCAIRAGQLGLDTIIVEAVAVGGTCLNVGCIPSKALIHVAEQFDSVASHAGSGGQIGIRTSKPKLDLAASMAWKDGIVARLTSGVGNLLKKSKVRQIHGFARFVDGKTVDVETGEGVQRIRAEHIVVATGSAPVELPNLQFGDIVISSTEALALTEIPKKLVVVGAGYIGLEIGIAYRKLGAQVTIVELSERLLPQYDSSLTEPVRKRIEALGIELMIETRAEGLGKSGRSLIVTHGGKNRELTADKILVAVGRRPATLGWGLEELHLDMNGPYLAIDAVCQTSMRNVYAIGDVTGEPMLAHRAMAQGAFVAERLSGERVKWNPEAIPSVCFVDPEIVSVGLLPHEASAKGIDITETVFPFAANGKAMAGEDDSGFVRILCRKKDGLIVGLQAVGSDVSEFNAAFSLAIEMGATAQDVAATIHAHPSRAEAIQEAAMRNLGRALHV